MLAVGIKRDERERVITMAKYRHRIFEMYDFLDEAISALAPRSTEQQANSPDPQLWSLRQLNALLVAGVTHAKFKDAGDDQDNFVKDLSKDFSQLVDLLPNNSRVLLDFEGRDQFCPDAIEALAFFKRKLQAKGSQLALCNLGPGVRGSFFPRSIGTESTR